MMAHHDVVPTEGQEWDYPPFAAEIHDGQIWARGTLDNKLCFCGCMEAFEHLLGEGYVPPRDIWFFSSCCEETSGPTADHCRGVAARARRAIPAWSSTRAARLPPVFPWA
jgi:carboxypeptidase PM20D1